MLGGELAQCLKDMVLNLLWIYSLFSRRRLYQRRSEVGIVYAVCKLNAV